jgi:uncharacterized membrane protein
VLPFEAWIPARRRVAVSLVTGIVATAVAAPWAAWETTVLAGWCATAATFVASTWFVILRSDGVQSRTIARRADESRVIFDSSILSACVASLIGVAFILVKAAHARGFAVGAMTALGVASVVLAWATVHIVFTLRYADLYFAHEDGIDFKDDEPPTYRDFAYVAFTIGMTYQVSDTDLKTKPIRHTALRHALLSYLFGVAIIALIINVVAGLAQ